VRRLLAAVVVLASLGGLVYACGAIDTGEPGDVATSGDQAIERLIPPPGSEILRQEAVGVDLAAGWTGSLRVNDVDIPEDQVDDDDLASTGVLTYTVGEGNAVERFEAGENCATVIYRRVEDAPADSRSRTWCFNVT